MFIHIDMDDSFLAPAGRFPGECYEVNSNIVDRKTKERSVRMAYRLDPTGDGGRYVAAINFSLDDRKALQRFLKDWLGSTISGTDIDLASLVGERGVLEIEHVPPTGHHKEAFRKIVRVLPPDAKGKGDGKADQ